MPSPMETKDIRSAIDRSLDRIPESVLGKILHIIEEVEKAHRQGVKMESALEQILSEDRGLLERLAR
jgi:hypothetical protein